MPRRASWRKSFSPLASSSRDDHLQRLWCRRSHRGQRVATGSVITVIWTLRQVSQFPVSNEWDVEGLVAVRGWCRVSDWSITKWEMAREKTGEIHLPRDDLKGGGNQERELKGDRGTSLVVQWPRPHGPNAGGPGSILVRELDPICSN